MGNFGCVQKSQVQSLPTSRYALDWLQSFSIEDDGFCQELQEMKRGRQRKRNAACGIPGPLQVAIASQALVKL